MPAHHIPLIRLPLRPRKSPRAFRLQPEGRRAPHHEDRECGARSAQRQLWSLSADRVRASATARWWRCGTACRRRRTACRRRRTARRWRRTACRWRRTTARWRCTARWRSAPCRWRCCGGRHGLRGASKRLRLRISSTSGRALRAHYDQVPGCIDIPRRASASPVASPCSCAAEQGNECTLASRRRRGLG